MTKQIAKILDFTLTKKTSPQAMTDYYFINGFGVRRETMVFEADNYNDYMESTNKHDTAAIAKFIKHIEAFYGRKFMEG